MIAARPAILPYNDAVRWIIDHANLKDRSFNTSIGTQLANFRSETFARIYTLNPFTQLLDADFINVANSRFNFDQMLKYWMAEPCKFSQRKDHIYPIDWFKEPYYLLAVILCQLYGPPNCSFFKEEWAPIAHHIITTGEYFPWASVMSPELKKSIQEFQKATVKKKPNFYLTSFIVDIFYVELCYPNMGWSWALPAHPLPPPRAYLSF